MFRKLVSSFLAILFLAVPAIADTIVTGSYPYVFIPGTTISSSQMNADFDYVKTQVNTNAAKNGVNSSITALLGLTTPLAQTSGGSPIFTVTAGGVGGTANAITISSSTPAVSSFTYTTGNTLLVPIASDNTGATTINVNGLGAVNILRQTSNGLVALARGELQAGQNAILYYDGTQFQLINRYPLFGLATSLASGSTTDLGTIGSHFVNVTGTTTITSFGSSASVNEPIYLLKFAGALTLTYNATSLITPGGADIAIIANDELLVEYLGSGNWRIIQRWTTGVIPSIETVNALSIRNNTGTPNTQIDISFSSSILCNTSNYCIRTGSFSGTNNAAGTGVGGLDTGSLGASAWYYVYAISNGTTTSTLLSTSATTPTMPSGYVYKYRIGAVRTGGSSTFLRTLQKGKRAQYEVIGSSTTPNMPIVVSGTSGSPTTPTWTAVGISNYVPTTAPIIRGVLFGNSMDTAGGAIVAPNNSYGAYNSTTNPPPIAFSATAATDAMAIPFELVLESTDIYYASVEATAGVACMGWIDSVNAN